LTDKLTGLLANRYIHTYKLVKAFIVHNFVFLFISLEFADESKVKEIVKKYSSFVGSNIELNGTKSNDLRPVWLMDPKEVDDRTHEDFYRFVANSYDKPRFTFHFRCQPNKTSYRLHRRRVKISWPACTLVGFSVLLIFASKARILLS
jgi:hypothetical protein